jgi:hypothetical protein
MADEFAGSRASDQIGGLFDGRRALQFSPPSVDVITAPVYLGKDPSMYEA